MWVSWIKLFSIFTFGSGLFTPISSIRIRNDNSNNNESQRLATPLTASRYNINRAYIDPSGLLLQDYKDNARRSNFKSTTPFFSPTKEPYDVSDLPGLDTEVTKDQVPVLREKNIPAALRRVFVSSVQNSPTRERLRTDGTPITTRLILASNSVNKTKNVRRKVKRPQKIKDTTTSKIPANSTINLLETKKVSSNGTGDNNLAFEIESNDGKYALIDSYFNDTDVDEPGVISYHSSDDFPSDNITSLGNLHKNDIWLSEGNLLVLKGGEFDTTNKEIWEPIDAFTRQNIPLLKIPLNSKNPPPFPIFVNKSGPPVFLGGPPPFFPYPPIENFGNGTIDPSFYPPPGMIPLHPNGTLPHFPFIPPSNNLGINSGINHVTNPLERPGGSYVPPYDSYVENKTLIHPNPPSTGHGVPRFPPTVPFSGSPQFPLLPPLVLNPNDNETDDPSIFLPPPYDFDYAEDNSTLVPPGPFAPGLVVPPPKDFYTVFNRTRYSPTNKIKNVDSTGPFIVQKQRSNAKKPKFPVTNLPVTQSEAFVTIIPEIHATNHTTNVGKLRSKTFISSTPRSNDNIFRTRPTTAKLEIKYLLSSTPPSNQAYHTSKTVNNLNHKVPKSLTSSISLDNLTTPQKFSNKNVVYVQGRLKTFSSTLDESGNTQAKNPPSSRPAFNALGYPARILEHESSLGISDAAGHLYSERPKTLPTSTTSPIFRTQIQYSNTPSDYREINRYRSPVLNSRTDNTGKKSKTNAEQVISLQIDAVGAPLQPTYASLAQPHSIRMYEHPLYNFQQNRYGKMSLSINDNLQQPLIPRQSNIGLQQPTAFQQDLNKQHEQLLNRQQGERLYPSNQAQLNNIRTSTFNPLQNKGVFQPIQHPRSWQSSSFPFNGYYSPITNYHQSAPVQPRHNSNQPFYTSALLGRISDLQPIYAGYPLMPTLKLNHDTPSDFETDLKGFSEGQIYPQLINGHYSSQRLPTPRTGLTKNGRNFAQKSSVQPILSSPEINYRKPFSSLEAELGSVRAHSEIKAGPGTNSFKGSSISSPATFYSFQRGGPGGFSYKIQL